MAASHGRAQELKPSVGTQHTARLSVHANGETSGKWHQIKKAGHGAKVDAAQFLPTPFTLGITLTSLSSDRS